MVDVGYTVDAFQIAQYDTRRMSCVAAMATLLSHDRHDTTFVQSAYRSMVRGKDATAQLRLLHSLVGGGLYVFPKDRLFQLRRIVRCGTVDAELNDAHPIITPSFDVTRHVAYLSRGASLVRKGILSSNIEIRGDGVLVWWSALTE